MICGGGDYRPGMFRTFRPSSGPSLSKLERGTWSSSCRMARSAEYTTGSWRLCDLRALIGLQPQGHCPIELPALRPQQLCTRLRPLPDPDTAQGFSLAVHLFDETCTENRRQEPQHLVRSQRWTRNGQEELEGEEGLVEA